MSGGANAGPDRGYQILWWTAAGFMGASGAGASLLGVAGELPHIWLLAPISFVWLTLDWPAGLHPSASLRTAATVAAISAIGFVTAFSMEASLVDCVRTAVGVPIQAYVMALGYRWARTRLLDSPRHPHLPEVGAWRNQWAREWAPTDSRDIAALGFAATLSGLVSLLIGAAPGLHLGAVGSALALQWLSHVFVTTTVGGATILITFSTWQPADLNQPWGKVFLLWLTSVALLAWVYTTGTVTMAWLSVLPILYVAMSYRLWTTSTFGILVGLVSILFSPTLNTLDAPIGPIPLGVVMDLLVSTLIIVSLLLAQLNQRRDQLVQDLEAERHLARRQIEIQRNMFESMPDGFVVLDRDLGVRLHNAASVQLLGRAFPDEKPPSWTEYFSMTKVDGSALTDRELLAAQFLTFSVAGSSLTLRQTVTPLSDDHRDGWIVCLSDITDHQNRLQELSGFAGIVAHDLRTPLTSLEGWLEMAQETLEAGDQEKAGVLLTRAQTSNRRMREVISNWLDYTVQREGTLASTEFPLSVPLRATAAAVAESGPHIFTLNTFHDVRADLGLVRQVFANLIGNASKFVHPGETPNIEVRSSLAEPGWIRVEVIDRGIGLPPGEEELIFDEYHRAAGAAQKLDGFGIGLAFCRRLVERHGGQISAATNEYGGATFTFTLPAAETGARIRSPRTVAAG
ncbi:sensor histidine kinase [Nocardioides gilvus]|uniref:sensor histidine kinase n=1 Tax=Nocardioides gilvus TaxID=1735589 RepID=UPI0013A55FAC|nr:ATP-binding protein [Nocardioides gilvus]